MNVHSMESSKLSICIDSRLPVSVGGLFASRFKATAESSKRPEPVSVAASIRSGKYDYLQSGEG